MNDDPSEIVNYRASKVFETWEEAEALSHNQSWNGPANRLCYACFYTVSALLLKQEFYAKTHWEQKPCFISNSLKPV